MKGKQKRPLVQTAIALISVLGISAIGVGSAFVQQAVGQDADEREYSEQEFQAQQQAENSEFELDTTQSTNPIVKCVKVFNNGYQEPHYYRNIACIKKTNTNYTQYGYYWENWGN